MARENALTVNDDIRRRFGESPQKEAGNQYPKRDNLEIGPDTGFTTFVELKALDQIPLSPHQGFQFSRNFAADILFGDLPVHKLRFTLGDLLPALVENIFV